MEIKKTRSRRLVLSLTITLLFTVFCTTFVFLGKTEASASVFDNCDSTTGWSSDNTLSSDTSDKKEGTASLTSNGSGTVLFAKAYATPVNSGLTPEAA
jgi:hypothetical protein